MKTYTLTTSVQRIAILLILLVFSITVRSQYRSDSLTVKAEAAIELITGTKGTIDSQTAYTTLLKLANQGNPTSMNAVGRLLIEGLGCTMDTIAGLAWLNKAGDAGYYSAWHNLGLIYKYGRSGVKQDFDICFYYFEKLAKAKCELQNLGLYDAGFMLYKGLGCTQNYQKAFEYFLQGAGMQSPPCMYMLALCYRNGYGTNQDAGKGGYWLTQSVKAGYSPAVDEYRAGGPERTPVHLRASGPSSTKLIAVPEAVPHIRHIQGDDIAKIDGQYEGVLATYDWSGKHVLKEASLNLIITTEGDQFVAEWREQDMEPVTVTGVWKESALTFTDARQKRQGHYDANQKVLWTFTNATMQYLENDTSTFLVGNLQMFSPQTMEPNQPMYLSLRKTDNLNSSEKGTQKRVLYAYPNPFEEGLNISFYQEKEANVTVSLYRTSGEKVYSANMGKYSEGQNHITLTLGLTPGAYLLTLTSGKNTQQSIVIKK